MKDHTKDNNRKSAPNIYDTTSSIQSQLLCHPRLWYLCLSRRSTVTSTRYRFALPSDVHTYTFLEDICHQWNPRSCSYVSPVQLLFLFCMSICDPLVRLHFILANLQLQQTYSSSFLILQCLKLSRWCPLSSLGFECYHTSLYNHILSSPDTNSVFTSLFLKTYCYYDVRLTILCGVVALHSCWNRRGALICPGMVVGCSELWRSKEPWNIIRDIPTPILVSHILRSIEKFLPARSFFHTLP